MWRFLLISFAVLGLSFYELSGGADYTPAPNSIQARADLVRPQARPTTEAAAPGARSLAEMEALMDRLGETEAQTAELSVTLAAARTDGIGIIKAEAEQPEAADAGARGEDDASIDAAIAAAMGETPEEDAQLRRVKEGTVEMRTGPGLSFDTVTRVTRGTKLAVTEDPGHGWLKVRLVDGYRTGWLAEWLLTAPQ